MQSHPTPMSPPILCTLGAVLLLAGCSGDKQPALGGGAPQVPAVTVVTVRTESVPVTAELPGRTTPYLVAEVRPPVTGIVKERLFKEGSDVKGLAQQASIFSTRSLAGEEKLKGSRLLKAKEARTA